MTRLPSFEVPSYGARGRLRPPSPRGRAGESQYDREERLKLEMQMRLREAHFALPMELEKKREEAKIEAEEWEFKYTAKQRADIAQREAARQKMWKDPNFSQEEKMTADRLITLDIAGVKPSMVPRDPSRPRYPEGQDIGNVWMESDGATMTRESDGTPKLIQRYDQGPEHHKMETQKAWEKARGELQLELMREEVEVPGEGDKPPTKRKRYENWEIQELLNVAGFSSGDAPFARGAQQAAPQQPPAPPQPQVQMGLPSGELTGEQRQEIQRRMVSQLGTQARGQQQPEQATDAPRELIGWSRGMGVRRTKADADLPEFVGMAQAFMREVKNRTKRGKKISPRMSRAIQEAQAILSQYKASRGP